VAWIYERKWEQLLVILAEADGAPVFRRKLVSDLYQDRPKGSQRLAEITFELKANLHELGSPDDAVISDRHAIRLGPEIGVRVAAPVAVGPERPSGVVNEPDASPPLAPSLPIEDLLRQLPRRQAERCVAIAEQAYSHLWGPEREDWFLLLDRENDNVLASLEWALESDDQELALRLAGSLWPYWYARARSDEGWLLLERALSTKGHLRGSLLEARCLNGSGALAAVAGDESVARRRLQSALEVHTSLGQSEGMARVLGNMAVVEYRVGDYDQARSLFTQAIDSARRSRAYGTLVTALKDASLNELADGDLDRAEQLLLEALTLTDSSGDESETAFVQISLANVAQFRSDWNESRRLADTALRTFAQAGNLRGIANASRTLGFAAYSESDFILARPLFETSLNAARALHDSWSIGESLRYLASLTRREGDTDGAIDLYRESVSYLEDAGDAKSLEQARSALHELTG
jgi:tetratricopeptide (TPR) repeat protein